MTTSDNDTDTPTRPPRLRTSRRVRTIPPGKDSLAAERSDATAESYGARRGRPVHLHVARAAVLWAGSFAGRYAPFVGVPLWVTLPVAVAAARARRWWMTLVVLFLVGISGGVREWSAPSMNGGACGGIIRLVDDPRTFGASTSAVVSLGGGHLRAYAWGRTGAALSRMLAGEQATASGTCGPVAAQRRDRELVSHVVGRMSLTELSEVHTDGGPLHRGANRVRRILVSGTRTMSHDTAALFTGLVIGDDREQPRAMVEQFRASGLSHLCSVSGQNVVYVLAAFSPLTRRLRPVPRLLATLAVLGWFVVLTRAEPSVLRAAAMATVVAVNFFRGNPMNARSVLAVSVAGLLVIDPMLAHSVGFMLSAGATAGLAWVSAPLEKVGLPAVLASTVAAQVGTLPVTLLVFGRIPVVSLVANPIAVPVAGFVMLLGMPVVLLAGIVPDPVAAVLAWTMAVPTGFVALVARTCARF